MELVLHYPHQFSWVQHPVCFTLYTDDETIARRAGELLGYWDRFAQIDGAKEFSVRREMIVEKAGNGWKFMPSEVAKPNYYGESASVMRAIETEAALAFLEQHEQVLTLHGALLAKGDAGVLVVGPSGAGKSTISCALWAAGWQLLADDVSLVDARSAMAWPLMRRISLRNPSRDLLGNEFWQRMIACKTADATPEGYVFHPDELEGQSRSRKVRVAAIAFLRRLGALDPGAGRTSPIGAAQALMALAPYTNVIRYADMGAAIDRLGPLVNQVPCFDLGRGPIADMVKAIDELIAAGVQV